MGDLVGPEGLPNLDDFNLLCVHGQIPDVVKISGLIEYGG